MSSKKQTTLNSFIKEKKEEKIQEEEFIHPVDLKASKEIVPIDDFINGLGSWSGLLSKYTSTPQMKKIYDFIKQEYSSKTCYPPQHLIFNAFSQTPLSNLKVVIVGQDPYINEGEAMGLCFSVPKGIKIPPSLANIYKNLNKTVPGFQIPKNGDLTKWANQGVFLLNAVLTVEAKKSNSHKDCGWTQFTDHVIQVINENCDGIVFLLWGKPAQQKAKKVNRTKHHILETSHPSPLSAHNGFLDSNHFIKCNEYLQNKGKKLIDWTL